ncbi:MULTISPECIES: hypothetical protein [Citrobacter freundii complex]|jgi:hypothetical protein|nr:MULTISPECIES: hypothetical protein [Citrobacter freundii complex]EKV4362953.1 hypothetical protein [Citrobacter freundii]ELE2063295.1 hypothetical protein [Citrobacter freundii]ELK6674066.1 hypothetical protein [Citrobacter freundii]KLV86686.1 hypothetical protein SK37_00644 [Citrobacter sp. MGH109]MBN4829592.1 hypothetical protein [Citrobacter freundii]
MNPFDLPSDHFEARKMILIESSSAAMQSCVKYINERYERRTLLQDAIKFCSHELTEAPCGDINSLSKVGFFPWVEASQELDQSLSLILKSNIKNAYDSYRRAIELVITGAFFVSDNTDPSKARAWIQSDRSTPNFQRACKDLVKSNYFESLNNKYDWLNDVLSVYWKFCNVVHVQGIDNSFKEISPIYSFINGIGVPAFTEKSCKTALDDYILTVSYIAVIVAASNPFLLQGFDLDKKFGINPPVSGFFYPDQAERLMELIPKKYKPHFKELLEIDENIVGVRSWFESLPDITEEELYEQMRQFNNDAGIYPHGS